MTNFKWVYRNRYVDNPGYRCFLADYADYNAELLIGQNRGIPCPKCKSHVPDSEIFQGWTVGDVFVEYRITHQCGAVLQFMRKNKGSKL